MKNSDNQQVDQFFRTQAEQLQETPSRATWKRLERRLDTHQRRSRFNFTPTLGMVAAVLLLVVFAFLFSTLNFEQERPIAADMVNADVVPIESAVDPEAYKVVEYTIKYRDRMRNIIDEGSEDTKLKVRQP
jgi:hypothetical protein